ncbi:MAG TPA: hypothetical protein VEQ38_09905 [Verrucomicrobiae bacterium]|nr:hypothetical protein [Verrucomicrobiae bacterium]
MLVTVITVGNRANLCARRGFALIKNRFNSVHKGLDAIFVGPLLSQVAAKHAAGMLRRDVAQQFHRKAVLFSMIR